MLRFRWYVMAAIGIFAICLELYGRNQLHALVVDFPLIIAALVEGVFLPVLGGVFLTLADHAIRERTTVAYQLSRKEALTQAISNAQNWNDLLKTIVEFPRGVLPLVGSALLIYEPGSNQFEPEAFWGLYGVNPKVYNAGYSTAMCESCVLKRHTGSMESCGCEDSPVPGGEVERYCLPLMRGGQVVALLHFYISSRIHLSADQIKMLNSLAPEMALAIADGRSQRQNLVLKEKSDAQFRHIARDLHDNLAQNLIFVRHKLDELTGEDTLQEISNIRQDLQRMREVVDDAYINVRATLKELEANVSTDLSIMLRDYAHLIEDRHNLRFHFTVEGRPVPIPTRVARQVLAVFSEIVTNIEKHSQAETVDVRLAWDQDNLALSVRDDGVGFTYHGSNGYRKDGHMGLEIMQERAEEIQGKLAIQSAVGSGTQVTLWLPLLTDEKKGQFA